MAMLDGMNLSELINNRNFQNMLAFGGQKLDPEGVGGAIGGATIDLNKAMSTQESVDKMNTESKEFRDQLFAFMSGGKMTPKGEKGITETKFSGDDFTISGNINGSGLDQTGTGEAAKPGSGGGMSDPMSMMRDIAPFYSALLGR